MNICDPAGTLIWTPYLIIHYVKADAAQLSTNSF